MTDTVIGVSGFFANLSPDAFHLWATHYYKCRQDFQCPDRFSPVPYFLLCRAIELELKSRHLVAKRQPEVKDAYGHNIRKAYEALPVPDQTLTQAESKVLEAASDIYASKGFEYFHPEDALTGYTRFPDLATLDGIAKNLLRL